MAIISIVVALALLIAANALYVAGEFAAVAVSRTRIRALADDGHASARRLQPFVDSPYRLDRYIAGCQIGITLSSLVLGAYGQQALAPILAKLLGSLGGWQQPIAHTVAFIAVLAGLSVIQMVLGELVPKALALQFPDRTALVTAGPVSWSLRVFAPLIWVLNGSGLAVLRLLGIKHSTERHVHSPAELDLLLARGDTGELDPRERMRLRRALRLSSRGAKDLMVPRHRIVSITADATLDDAARLGSEQPYTRFPVHQGDIDDALGSLHTKDVVRAQAQGSVNDIRDLLRPIARVPLDASAEQILVTMREHRASQALVVDTRQRVAGLVTLRDVLAEVLGALADEFKSGPPGKPARSAAT